MTVASHYSINIAWSEEDQAYVVILPEWADRYAMPVASGTTYEEAVIRGRNALENYIRFALEDGRSLPAPRVFAAV
ncbi:MAG TPA: type II toxin-antitoxin system HicB family antitoxin [Chloroflexota bacterium]|nr:type II toxin-antitoxin system HicB family antitoxin [Chloroflexota bacterium]